MTHVTPAADPASTAAVRTRLCVTNPLCGNRNITSSAALHDDYLHGNDELLRHDSARLA
jgi:hypothetical protein